MSADTDNTNRVRPDHLLGKVFQETTVDELLELASALLVDAAARPALERVGVRGDFTAAEKIAVERALVDHIDRKGWRSPGATQVPFAYDCGGAIAWAPPDVSRDPLLLLVALTLARWIAGGQIRDVNAPEARAFLDDRYFNRPSELHGVFTKTITATEVMWIAHDLVANPAYWSVVQKVGEFGVIDDRDWTETIVPIDDATKIKYGLYNRFVIGAHDLLRQIAAGNIDSLDSPAAWEFLRSDTNFIRD